MNNVQNGPWEDVRVETGRMTIVGHGRPGESDETFHGRIAKLHLLIADAIEHDGDTGELVRSLKFFMGFDPEELAGRTPTSEEYRRAALMMLKRYHVSDEVLETVDVVP